jgi:hypothetical protein
MSDTSPEGYFKYFNQKDVKTRLKTDAKKLKVWKNGSKSSDYSLQKHDEVTVLKKKSINDLDGNYEITSDKYKGVIFLVSRHILEKPKAGTEAIKPQNFALDGINLSIEDIQKLVKKNVEDIPEVKDVIKEYLIFLTQSTAKPNTAMNFKHFSKIVIGELKGIAKNFGEVLSGIAVLANPKLFPNLNIKKDDKVFFPKSLTEGLYDFSIVGKVGSKTKEKYLFSVKAMLKGGSPNTVKPEDIIRLINSSAKAKKRWVGTHQYNIIKILAEGSIRYGPLEAIKYTLNKKVKLNTKDIPPGVQKKLEAYKTVSMIDDIIKQDQKKRNKKIDDLLKSSETYIEYISRTTLDFTEMFLDAINSQVYYIIVRELGAAGVKWETVGDVKGINHKEIDRINLRGKHDLNGRMGFDL